METWYDKPHVETIIANIFSLTLNVLIACEYHNTSIYKCASLLFVYVFFPCIAGMYRILI